MSKHFDFALNVEAVPQLKSGFPFDNANIRETLQIISEKYSAGVLPLSRFNDEYLKLYSRYDQSGEFQQAVELQTFDETKRMPSFQDLMEVYPEDQVPFLDQTSVSHEHVAPHQRSWSDNGILLIRGMLDPAICEYVAVRESLHLGMRGFPTYTPYIEHDVIMRMFCSPEMNTLINDLVGETLGLHFNLTPFTSTERGWHQDEYLNPPGIFGRYIAAWIAVDDVPEESGPFEFIAGSHKLPTASREKVMPYLKQKFQLGHSPGYTWSGSSAMFVNPAYFFKFVGDDKPVTKFLGKKGDVLLWHARLIHRGAPPTDRSVTRPGIIGHYSPIRIARWFGNDIRRYGNGGYYWHFDNKAS
jgi:hypothetical protein